jgi:acetoacetyl-CoA synthetase
LAIGFQFALTMPTEPVWRPDPARMRASAMANFMRESSSTIASAPAPDAPYSEWHRWSCEEPAAFWAAVWRSSGVVADTGYNGLPWSSVLQNPDAMRPPKEPGGPRWFEGARLNFAENLLRYRGPEPAIIFRGEGAARQELSRDALADEVARFAAGLRALGVRAGDRVAGVLPNIPEAVIAMLGAAACGAVWTSCSPDFGVHAVRDRFGQVEPRVLVVADGYRYAGRTIDSLDRAHELVAALPSIECVVVVPFLGSAHAAGAAAGLRGAMLWREFVGVGPVPPLAFDRLAFDHPLYILFSSGTTGLPKCLVHGAGGTLLQHLKEHRLHVDLRDGDRMFYFTTCGWMMWNWLASALAVGATIVLYDGAPMPTQDRDILWRVASDERVSVFGTSAKFIALSEKEGLRPATSHDLRAVRTILSTGSPLAAQGFDYVAGNVGASIQLSSISGGTDIVSCFALGNPLTPVWRGEIQCLGLGMDVNVLDPGGGPLRGSPGELVCTRPFPSMPVAFWNDPDGAKYRSAYFEFYQDVGRGIWRHGDWAELTAHGGLVIHGRSDATLNPGGVRIGTAEIYREVDQIDEIMECVVVGQEVAGGDVRIVLFIRLRPGLVLDDALRTRIRDRIREHGSPHHVPKVIAQVSDIPRTMSGKITEIAVREVVHGRAVQNVDALANPEALALFRDHPALRQGT